MNEEQFCLHMLRLLREDYEHACKPYMDRLVKIKRLSAGPIYVLQRAPAVYLDAPIFGLPRYDVPVLDDNQTETH